MYVEYINILIYIKTQEGHVRTSLLKIDVQNMNLK